MLSEMPSPTPVDKVQMIHQDVKEIITILQTLDTKPKSWQERKAQIKHWWDKPFVWFDCVFEQFFFCCRRQTLNNILISLARLS